MAVAKDALCVALDGSDREWIVHMAGRLAETAGWLKVGLEAFTAFGPEIVNEIGLCGPQVFLDLKLHDIPNTVRQAAANCARSGARLFNVHAAGGAAMLEAAMEGVHQAVPVRPPRVLAVTLLTSLGRDGMAEIGFSGGAEELVLRLADLARRCGVDGVVASAREAAAIRRLCGPDFLIVTPGIRPAWSVVDDQSRVVTPRRARELGADILVIGRPITRAESPAEAARMVLEEMSE